MAISTMKDMKVKYLAEREREGGGGTVRWYHREIESISSKILTVHTLTCYQESGYLFREGKKLGHKSRETGEFPKSGMPR